MLVERAHAGPTFSQHYISEGAALADTDNGGRISLNKIILKYKAVLFLDKMPKRAHSQLVSPQRPFEN
jgi:hypothetical protein